MVSGTTNSKVTVDATGADTKIGVQSSDTIVVPTGSTNVAGTSVDLPPPTVSGGDASTVSVKIGGQELTIQANQADTKMTFKVVDIGGVQTPILAVTGSAQVSGSGDNQPIVSIAGNVIRTGKSGGSSQVCNTVVQASSNSTSDAVHVVTCYIVLDAGSFSALNGGNNFAALKDGIVWAGETAEFDKNGKVISAYLGSRSGDTGAVGDDMLPGGNKFTGMGYQVGAFIPRLAGAPLRLNGAKLDESIANVFSKALGTAVQLASPSQGSQGVLNFTISGDAAQAQTVLAYTLSGDTACMLPSKRIRVDTSRADGLSFGAEGEINVVTGGLITTFVPTVSDPALFASRLTELVPGSTNTLRWNGTWRITAENGTMYVGRPQWSFRDAASDAEIFGATAEGNISYNDNGRSQLLFPDFYDYDTLKATFRVELNDPALSVQPRMDGTALAVIHGKNYILAPQWNVVQLPDSASKPAWWEENGVLYIKNADGSVQGFTHGFLINLK